MSTLEIHDRRMGDITILDLAGDIRIGGGNIALQKAIRSLIDQGRNQILLNLAGVTHIDSSGLGELISGHILSKNKAGQVKLLNLSPRLLELMAITKLTTVFTIYDNESEALDSFKMPLAEVPIAAQGMAASTTALP